MLSLSVLFVTVHPLVWVRDAHRPSSLSPWRSGLCPPDPRERAASGCFSPGCAGREGTVPGLDLKSDGSFHFGSLLTLALGVQPARKESPTGPTQSPRGERPSPRLPARSAQVPGPGGEGGCLRCGARPPSRGTCGETPARPAEPSGRQQVRPRQAAPPSEMEPRQGHESHPPHAAEPNRTANPLKSNIPQEIRAQGPLGVHAGSPGARSMTVGTL